MPIITARIFEIFYLYLFMTFNDAISTFVERYL